jgi:hypothetical protein
MLNRARVAVFTEIHTKHINTLGEQNVVSFFLNLMIHNINANIVFALHPYLGSPFILLSCFNEIGKITFKN